MTYAQRADNCQLFYVFIAWSQRWCWIHVTPGKKIDFEFKENLKKPHQSLEFREVVWTDMLMSFSQSSVRWWWIRWRRSVKSFLPPQTYWLSMPWQYRFLAMLACFLFRGFAATSKQNNASCNLHPCSATNSTCFFFESFGNWSKIGHVSDFLAPSTPGWAVQKLYSYFIFEIPWLPWTLLPYCFSQTAARPGNSFFPRGKITIPESLFSNVISKNLLSIFANFFLSALLPWEKAFKLPVSGLIPAVKTI